MLYENGEFERIRPHWTPLECGIIFDGIPEGAISRKVGLIWGIPANGTEWILLSTIGTSSGTAGRPSVPVVSGESIGCFEGTSPPLPALGVGASDASVEPGASKSAGLEPRVGTGAASGAPLARTAEAGGLVPWPRRRRPRRPAISDHPRARRCVFPAFARSSAPFYVQQPL